MIQSAVGLVTRVSGTRSKMVITDNRGPVEVTVPQNLKGSFEPQLVKKH